MKNIKMLSLFSGIGAPEKALKNLGFDVDVINYCEIDKFASTSYSAIHVENETLYLKVPLTTAIAAALAAPPERAQGPSRREQMRERLERL